MYACPELTSKKTEKAGRLRNKGEEMSDGLDASKLNVNRNERGNG